MLVRLSTISGAILLALRISINSGFPSSLKCTTMSPNSLARDSSPFSSRIVIKTSASSSYLIYTPYRSR
ncbi:MAG: hypothetical protein QW658_04065, partial [Candidatus Bathyarchaeia archaeon]